MFYLGHRYSFENDSSKYHDIISCHNFLSTFNLTNALFLLPKPKISFSNRNNIGIILPKNAIYLFLHKAFLFYSFFKNCIFCCYNSSFFSSKCFYFWICCTLYRSWSDHFLEEYTNIPLSNTQSLSVSFSFLLLFLALLLE